MKHYKKLIGMLFYYSCVCTIVIILLAFKVASISNECDKLNNDYSQKELEARVAENRCVELYSEIVNDCATDANEMLELIEPLKYSDKKEYILKYKCIVEKHSDVLDPPETVYDYFDEEQIQIMWQCIETEVYDCEFDAKVNVANVILNRVYHDLFPTDPVEIITEKNQFAYGRTEITEDTKLALEYAFMIEDTTDGCIGFRSDICPQVWNGWEYQFTDGRHYFYK